ncbi:MAG: YeeE/YedE family protein [Azonexus sp.]|jgi:uncharacterized membrane protein YedE/YeeE|nr:YeeE/YedE family protein [Azonexus sp.]
MSLLLACLSGLIFGLGLLLSGMSHPAKVQGFLDITGAWDPSLAFTMAGAIGVAMPCFFWARQRSRTWLGLPLALPVNSRVDRRLVVGSVLFGVGWGLSGICPGPALVGLGGGFLPAMVFVAGFCGGILAFNRRSRSTGDA